MSSAYLAAVRARRLASPPDYKETFDLGLDADGATLRNIWPPAHLLPGFRPFFVDFYGACTSLAGDLLAAVALGLGLPSAAFFDRFHGRSEHQVRLLHYPATTRTHMAGGGESGDGTVRLGAHTDYGTLTFLFQDRVGGLEVADPTQDDRVEDSFLPVPWRPGTIVVNVGDLLQRWSNGVLRSTMHRVGEPPAVREEGDGQTEDATTKVPARYSIPFFVGADSDALVECLPGCSGPDRPKKYAPVRAGEYIDMRLNGSY